MRAFVFAILAVGACATAPAMTVAPDAAPVVAAERAFAARAGEVGWVPAFREFVAPDGQLGQANGYTDAPAAMAETPDDGNRNLFWWPAFAGISRSGDFGFTTGAVSFDEAHTPRGHYFTVWRRQPDGSWKWIYDGGVGPITDAAALPGPGGDLPMLPVAARGERNAEAAVAAVTALERAGMLRFAPDARLARTREPFAADAARSTPQDVSYEPVRVEASEGGDLVMVLGHASWFSYATIPAAYARMWQRRADSWVVVYDQLIIPQPVPIPQSQ